MTLFLEVKLFSAVYFSLNEIEKKIRSNPHSPIHENVSTIFQINKTKFTAIKVILTNDKQKILLILWGELTFAF